MLSELSLRNFILIEDIRLSFSEGLNVLTGETGAGKSILLEGLRIALGSRTSKDYLRDPAQKAVFELIFTLDDDLLAITREIYPSGKAISRLNGDIVNVDVISQKVLRYLDIYGQRDHFMLLDPAYQRDLIDRFDAGSKEFEEQLRVLRSQQQEALEKLTVLEELSGKDISREERDLKELESLRIDPDKDSELDQRFRILSHAKDLHSLLEETSEALEHGLSDLSEAERLSAKAERFDQNLQELSGRLSEAQIEISDILDSFRQKLRDLDLDSEDMEAMEQRIAELFDVRKRFQRDLMELKQYEAELKEKVRLFEHASEEKETLKTNLMELKQQARLISDTWNDHRSEQFEMIKTELRDILQEVGLKDVSLELSFQEKGSELIQLKGNDSLEILASMNRGELHPLKNVLSGGEMSRFILALKAIFSSKEETRTMIFDEIDTGISGITAYQVGKLIKTLSRGKQVIAITHLPQLAAFADVHSVIEKHDGVTTVKRLNPGETVNRIAEMMASRVTEASIRGASELIDRAGKDS